MKRNNLIYIILIILISSCEEEAIVSFSNECVECIEYEHQQTNNDTPILVILEAGNYCIGDSIFEYFFGGSVQFLEILDEELLDVMTNNGYCTFLVDSIIE